ncbi:alcohol dehydrogenase catalytic domain-containing protein [Jatrophihabitans telluris]|uniref:Alcohol dehydrogenase catalytic domain-containing protein n=1 Tax=Jatrophihabitans telluris TaxID=2038343 RepID=A0ABY4QYP4_9ACTN|nr:alcohol dehydrogenase catalytic domain-containing protein [Jatrophihabitans telluris]UQX88544.1 alcohol dehydrogenase catalytic domain-containing protein [Jatrophihabitans telluris]
MTSALICRGPGNALEVVEVSLGPVGEDEVRVRVAAAGVCHSDLSMINGTVTPAFPLVLGHEAAGVVAEVGSAVRRVGVGDHVVLNWAPACRQCWFCLRGEPWLCATNAGVASRPRGRLADGTPLHAMVGVGALAEEVIVGERAVIALPPELPLTDAALIGCAVLTGFGAVRHTAAVAAADSVAVVGLGGVGLSVLSAARMAGAGPIIAIDSSPAKADLAYALGASEFVVSDATSVRQIRGLTEGRGVDHAFECVGRSVTISLAYKATRRGGNCIVVGMGRSDDLVSLSALEIFHFARTLTASVYGSSDPDVDVPDLVASALSGELDLRTLVSHRISLAEVPVAFERMAAGQGARSLVVL